MNQSGKQEKGADLDEVHVEVKEREVIMEVGHILGKFLKRGVFFFPTYPDWPRL